MKKIIIKLSKLIKEWEEILEKEYNVDETGFIFPSPIVPKELFISLKLKTTSFLEENIGSSNIYVKSFKEKIDTYSSSIKIGIELLNTIKEEIEEGNLIIVNKSDNIENISGYGEILTIIQEFKFICVRIGRSQANEEDKVNYELLRKKIIANKEIYEYLPSFIKYNSTSYDYWLFIKNKFEHYAGRDKFISDSFKKAVHHLELKAIGFTNEKNEKISSEGNLAVKKTHEKYSKIDENLCFVLMPFDEKFDGVFDLIKEDLDSFKLNIKRADNINKPGVIIEDIFSHIGDSKFLIADLTDSNPNVFYEVGYADCLDKEIILISQDNSEKFPFDVSGKRIIIYEDTIAGQKDLRNELKGYVRNIIND